MNKAITMFLGAIAVMACGGSGSSSSPTAPSTTGSSAAIPFMACAEWSDANWSLTFQGQTFSGGGAASPFFPGRQCFRFSAPAGVRTLTGTMRLAAGEESGAFAVSVSGTSFPGPGPLFGSVSVVSGPPGAFVNYCSVSWAEYPYRIPVNSTAFSIQFVLTSTSASVCP